jgi:hypothetical protein
MSCATLSPSATTALAIISVIARSVGTAIIKVMCLMEILYLLPRAEEPRCVSSNGLTIAGVRERHMGSLPHFLTKVRAYLEVVAIHSIAEKVHSRKLTDRGHRRRRSL